ncbi:periplasmic binding domain protein [Paraburkholderia xenovorans LB400]|uniref:Amino acid/amide ABC transporter substrate-binding protein, HAAT family n=1 Tax=Paraburkholderia xenovorans (strain LB400) TaxID=266265 RepID=Q13FM4_PARXL|nr:substrate-binding protein [Paraburkholderia xenovorans]ABE37115.1 amino acid/amide ABC transporter substrate-binding protein, HAAT family [Paraburkholderia xenovorans LB400]AIP34119.1 periplasmic binding domain protein [Paraburkholderia xenovorans LB400]
MNKSKLRAPASLTNVSRRRWLSRMGWAAAAISTGPGSWVIPAAWGADAGPIKLGLATDITGAISYAGGADANVARLLVKQINAAGGLLGRPIELYIEDTASNETIAVANTRKLIQRDKVDIVIGGVTSATRNAIKDVIVNRGRTLYIYPQLYEGGENTPYLFVTGPTPAQQLDPLIPWLIANGGKRFALPGANYVWPHQLNAYARKVIQEHGGEVVLEEYYPLDQVDYGSTVNRIINEKVDVVLATIIPPGIGPFLKQLHTAGFLARGGRLSVPYYDENTLGISPKEDIEGLATSLDYFHAVTATDPVSARIQSEYDKAYPNSRYLLAAGSAATGTYRAIKLWEAAVTEAHSVERDPVAAALDHAKIAEGPGGPAEFVPGQRHVRLRIYTAEAKSGSYQIVQRSPGLLDPKPFAT